MPKPGGGSSHSQAQENKLSQFLSEAYTHQGEVFSDWTQGQLGYNGYIEWCAAFIWACAKKVGGLVNVIFAPSISVSQLVRTSVQNKYGALIPGPQMGTNTCPNPGDFILYRWSTDSDLPDKYSASHIGIVYSITDKSNFVTIEGNTGSGSVGRCLKRNRSTSYSSIYGYYRPDWSRVGVTSSASLSYGDANYPTQSITPLYTSQNDEDDAEILEIGYLNSKYQPSINSSNIRLSVMNYTGFLNSLYSLVAVTTAMNTANTQTVTPSLTSSSTSSVASGSNASRIWNILVTKLGAYGTAGVMGNMYHESGLVPYRLQGDYDSQNNYSQSRTYTSNVDNGVISRCDFANNGPNGGGYGLCQWTYYTLKYDLYDFAKKNKTSVGDLEMQVNFLLHELQTQYSGLYALLRSATSVRQASDYFLHKFERPADQSVSMEMRRADQGQKYYDMYSRTPR